MDGPKSQPSEQLGILALEPLSAIDPLFAARAVINQLKPNPGMGHAFEI